MSEPYIPITIGEVQIRMQRVSADRVTRAEIAIREAAADFSAEIEACREAKHAHALWRKLRELEDYLCTLGNRAADRSEELA